MPFGLGDGLALTAVYVAVEPQTLCFLCIVYQAAIISQRELRLLGDGWLRRKQPKRQESQRGRKGRNIFARARRSDEIGAGLSAVLRGFYFSPALQIAGGQNEGSPASGFGDKASGYPQAPLPLTCL